MKIFEHDAMPQVLEGTACYFSRCPLSGMAHDSNSTWSGLRKWKDLTMSE